MKNSFDPIFASICYSHEPIVRPVTGNVFDVFFGPDSFLDTEWVRVRVVGKDKVVKIDGPVCFVRKDKKATNKIYHVDNTRNIPSDVVILGSVNKFKKGKIV